MAHGTVQGLNIRFVPRQARCERERGPGTRCMGSAYAIEALVLLPLFLYSPELVGKPYFTSFELTDVDFLCPNELKLFPRMDPTDLQLRVGT